MFSQLFSLFIAAWGIFFFVLILYTPHDRPLAKHMLLVFVVTQTLTPIGAVLSIGEGARPAFMGHLYNLFYLSGPALYFYIKALRQPTFVFGPRNLWHFVPVIAFFSYSLLFRYQEKVVLDSLHLLIMLTWFLAYLVAALRLLPTMDNPIWRWLYIPTTFYACTYLIRVAYVSLTIGFSWPGMQPDVAYLLTMSARIVFFFLVAIGGYRQRHVYERQEEKPPEDEGKYRKSAMEEHQMQAIWEKLKGHMTREQPFLDAGLRLAQLAEALEISPNDLSQVINAHAGQSFHDFVNSYRVQRARELIKKYAKGDKPMLDLSLEAGFGNSATFYKYFKKYLSVTPAQYRKTCQNP